MTYLHIWDLALKDVVIPYDEVLRVNDSVSLGMMVRWVLEKSDHYKNDVCVKIYCHGIDKAEVLDKKTGKYESITSQGGFGLALCKEQLTLNTMDVMSFWKGKVKEIDIYGCGAAYITPGREGKAGDGNLFCYKLAQVTGAYVRASTSALHYPGGTELGFEGTVLTYAPSGAVVDVTGYGSHVY
jgi:hypothetical protein